MQETNKLFKSSERQPEGLVEREPSQCLPSHCAGHAAVPPVCKSCGSGRESACDPCSPVRTEYMLLQYMLELSKTVHSKASDYLQRFDRYCAACTLQYECCDEYTVCIHGVLENMAHHFRSCRSLAAESAAHTRSRASTLRWSSINLQQMHYYDSYVGCLLYGSFVYQRSIPQSRE